MALDLELFEQTLAAIGPPAGYPSELPTHISDWLSELPVSEHLGAFFTSHSASAHYEVGPIAMLPHRRVYSESRGFPHVIDAGFLVVGSSGSGDPMVIDLTNEEVGFISHEKLWSYSSPEDLRADFRLLSPTLGRCLRDAHTSRNFPADYHDA